MKNGDVYIHYKLKKYRFYSIALPLNEFTGFITDLTYGGIAYDSHSPKYQKINYIQLYHYCGLTLIDKDTPHVIYQSEDDYNTDKIWAREVADFFGVVENNPCNLAMRFTRLDNS
ncbi:hypothetical protein [Bacillus toyonensis]|uniref:hypothetical protein n=1 Tax=Bacillus toyonensis TaxID=155322 RepID=UPI00159BA77D|nr:hypothetical protein [Bacillus toyonensis]